MIVHTALDAAEHARGVSSGLAAVPDRALLERLLDLPALVSVPNAAIWAQLSGQPPAVAPDRSFGTGALSRVVASARRSLPEMLR